MLKTPQEQMQAIASSSQAKRLSLKLTQAGLARRSGVSLGAIKKFEHSGKISLESLLKIAIALGASKEFDSLFAVSALPEIQSLDDLLKPSKVRKRGSLT